MKLHGDEKHSQLWLKLKKHFEAELESLRNRLESPGLTQDQTLIVRGEIIRLRKVLDMENPYVVIPK